MNHPNVRCSGPLSRRGFLEIGSIGAAGIGLADLLRLRAAANPTAGQTPDTAVILCWLGGGAPQTETYDMKPEAPLEFRGEFKPIKTVLPGLDVCELLPRHAQVADRFSVIRSISHQFIQHGGGTQQMLTARPPVRADGDAMNFYPSVGAVVSKMREKRSVGVPNNMLFSDEGSQVHNHGAAYLGVAHAPFNIGANFLTPEFKVQNLDSRIQSAELGVDERGGETAQQSHRFAARVR